MKRERPKRLCMLPKLDINTDSILSKADKSPDMMTYQGALSSVSYIIDKSGGVMILDGHGYYRARWEDLQVICEELRAWILPEAERWQKA